MKGKSRTTRRPAAKSVDDYFAGVPKPARNMLKELREAIRSAVPAETTETISYGIPCFKHIGAFGLVRRLFGAPQFVPHSICDRGVEGTQEFPYVQRHHCHLADPSVTLQHGAPSKFKIGNWEIL
jgi:hypothetical protein